ncbi:hypothetical protein [Cryptosporangium phraense]|uniref:Uncharacterized protein n=1 Tax=Cryptosporangium phraense TaxID=2593070 RepID=A0A545AFA8_9ACTN|nr:hypothetical protein [Cryptosporangium phraense]TQS39999.1 hypothetical protein FL583_37265 [Cryptosporangium phraense]
MTPSSPYGPASFAEVYPDVVAAGSLATALGRAAADAGLDLGEIQAADPMVVLEWAEVRSVTPEGRPLWVRTTPFERVFGIDGRSHDGQRLRGGTSDLTEVARAAAAWRSGATFEEIRRAAAFLLP